MPVSLRKREDVLAQIEEESRWVIKDLDHPLDKERMENNLDHLKNIVKVMAEEEYEIAKFVRVVSLGVQLLESDHLFWGRMLIILLVEDEHLNKVSALIKRLERILSNTEDASPYHMELSQALREDLWVRDNFRVITREHRKKS